MSTDRHPQMAEVLEFGQQLQSALEDQMFATDTETFTGTDEAETVQVTVDERRGLKDVFIEDGLLRLGAAEVAERVNQALRNAAVAANAASEAEHQRLVESLAGITTKMKDALGLA
jgi:DNA-binding protein YbaB